MAGARRTSATHDRRAGGAIGSRSNAAKAVGVGANSPLPWLAILLGFAAAFYVLPAVEVLRSAFTDSNLMYERYTYTYATAVDTLRDPIVVKSAARTSVFVIASVALQVLVGLAAAILLHRGQQRGLPGTALVRSVVLIAWVMPAVVSGVVWTLLVSEASYGLLNGVMRSIGLPPVGFVSDPENALGTIIVANAWRGAAFSMIMLYAGLQSIPQDVIEAAEVDGASAVQVFGLVILPMLRPIIAITVILATVGSMNTFDVVLAITAGGPGRATEVLSLLTYNTLFVDLDYAKACVLGLLMLALSLIFTALYMRYLPDRVAEPAAPAAGRTT